MARSKEVGDAIVSWAMVNKRHFSFRRTNDPFRLLVTEMLLRKTTARQVEGVYDTMFSKLRTVHDFACADVETIKSYIRPLGMHDRARQISSVARIIEDRYGGRVPCEYESLTSLPGVGPYVAGVVEVFGFGNSYPLIDSNVGRLLGRIEGFAYDSRRSTMNKLCRIYLSSCPKGQERLFHHGLLDIAALYCRPANPECASCPLGTLCKTGREII